MSLKPISIRSSRGRRELDRLGQIQLFVAALLMVSCGQSDPPSHQQLPAPAAGTLHEAAAQGRLDDVRRRIRARETLSQPDDRGWTPLHYAADAGHVDVVRALLGGSTIDGQPDPEALQRMRDAVAQSLEVMRSSGRLSPQDVADLPDPDKQAALAYRNIPAGQARSYTFAGFEEYAGNDIESVILVVNPGGESDSTPPPHLWRAWHHARALRTLHEEFAWMMRDGQESIGRDPGPGAQAVELSIDLYATDRTSIANLPVDRAGVATIRFHYINDLAETIEWSAEVGKSWPPGIEWSFDPYAGYFEPTVDSKYFRPTVDQTVTETRATITEVLVFAQRGASGEGRVLALLPVLVLNPGAHAIARGPDGRTPFDMAAAGGHDAVTKVLAPYSPRPTGKLREAIEMLSAIDEPERVREMLFGGTVREPSPIDTLLEATDVSLRMNHAFVSELAVQHPYVPELWALRHHYASLLSKIVYSDEATEHWTDEATASLRRGIEENPEAASLYLDLAHFAFAAGNSEAGLDALRQGVSANPNEHPLYLALSGRLIAARDHEDDPGDPRTSFASRWHYLLGEPPLDLEAIARAPDSLETTVTADEGVQRLVDELAAVFESVNRPLTFDGDLLVAWAQCASDSPPIQNTEPGDPFLSALRPVVDAWRTTRAWRALASHLRKRALVDEYRMDPHLMAADTAELGPFDWRHPQAHALYWLRSGERAITGNADDDQPDACRYILRQLEVMINLSQEGRVEFGFDFRPGYLPEHRWLASIVEEFDRLYATCATSADDDPMSIHGGAPNRFWTAVVRSWFVLGEYEYARELFHRSAHRFLPRPIAFEGFVRRSVVSRYDRDLALGDIVTSLRYAFIEGLGNNRPELVERNLQFARDILEQAGRGYITPPYDKPEQAVEAVFSDVMSDRTIALELRASIWRRADRSFRWLCTGSYERLRPVLEFELESTPAGRITTIDDVLPPPAED